MEARVRSPRRERSPPRANKQNFADETLEVLQRNQKTIHDVIFVETKDSRGSIQDFLQLATYMEYRPSISNEYGRVVNKYLKIVGPDFVMRRRTKYSNNMKIEYWHFKRETYTPVPALSYESIVGYWHYHEGNVGSPNLTIRQPNV